MGSGFAPPAYGGTVTMSADYMIDPGTNNFISLSLIDAYANGSAFDQAVLRIMENGTSMYSMQFDSVSAAVTYFTDRALGLAGYPNAERLWAQCLSLPCYPLLSDADADRVVAALAEALAR